MQNNKKKFSDFLTEFEQNWARIKKEKKSWTVWSSNQDLLRIFFDLVKRDLSLNHISWNSLTLEKKKPEDLVLELDQPDLFGDSGFKVCQDLHKYPKMIPQLAGCLEKTPVLIGLNADKLPKPLANAASAHLKIQPPTGREFNMFIHFLARKQQLKFKEDACFFLRDWLGDDPGLLFNEINRFGLLFSGLGQPIDRKTLEPHCDVLRQEQVFKISDLLLKGKSSEALATIKQLLDQGENALLLLGVLASFYRKCIEFSKKGEARGVPPWKKKDYQSFVHKFGAARLLQAMSACLQADIDLKTSKSKPDWLVLYPVIAPFSKNI